MPRDIFGREYVRVRVVRYPTEAMGTIGCITIVGLILSLIIGGCVFLGQKVYVNLAYTNPPSGQYEAESVGNTFDAGSVDCGTCSGERAVMVDTLTFNHVHVPKTGKYKLTVYYYFSGEVDLPRSLPYSVNGKDMGTIDYTTNILPYILS